jgi:arsenate reductase
MSQQHQVLFLCTGNSCRSQMAEAIVNDRLSEQWLAVSAGTKPSGYVHPKAIQVLAEWDIMHQGESKLADQFRDWDFDLVITVCDSAAEECPVWLGKGRRVHHSFPDPAEATGSEEEILAVFRQVRDDISEIIPQLLQEYR